MAYQLLVSRAQLTRITLACKLLDQSQPLTDEEMDDPNLELLSDTLEATLEHPDTDDVLHGICL